MVGGQEGKKGHYASDCGLGVIIGYINNYNIILWRFSNIKIMDWSEPIRVGKSAQLVDQCIYQPAGGLDLPLQSSLIVRRAGLGGAVYAGRASVPPDRYGENELNIIIYQDLISKTVTNVSAWIYQYPYLFDPS